jgi:hypothetical protein
MLNIKYLSALMKIFFWPDKAILIAEWTSEITHMSVTEYLGCWNTILRHVQTFKPTYLLIDATNFEYRRLYEVNHVFNEISQLITPENMGIVTTSNLLGSITLEHLLISCLLQGHQVFENVKEGLYWLNS